MLFPIVTMLPQTSLILLLSALFTVVAPSPISSTLTSRQSGVYTIVNNCGVPIDVKYDSAIYSQLVLSANSNPLKVRPQVKAAVRASRSTGKAAQTSSNLNS